MSDIHARAKTGIKLLMGRQVFLQVLTFGGGVVLARVLGPAQFGLYAIATVLVSAFAMLGDFGLAPSFIQRKEDLTELDLRVGFTLQQIFTTAVVGVLFLAAPWLVHLYPKAPPETVWLVRTLAFSLYLTSWRSMSALQLERRLRYDRLAWIEVAETLAYQGLAVGLAVAGYGVWSFVWATLVRGLLGTVLVFGLAPWKVRLGYDRAIARDILRFGIPFQLQSLANQVGSWIMPLFVGALIGPQAVGYLTWASSNGKKPLILVDNVMRVAFPHFSRIQNDRAEVERILTRYLAGLLLVAGLWFAVILVAGPSLVEWLYTKKWLPAVPALALCAAAMGFDIISWVLGVTLNGLGQVHFTTRIILSRTIGSVALSIPLVIWIGFLGVPVAYLMSSAVTIPWMFLGLGRGAFSRILRQIAWVTVPIAASLIIGLLSLKLPLSLQFHAVLTSIVVLLVFSGGVYAAGPTWLKKMIVVRLSYSLPLLRKAIVAPGQ